jgi:hypothetical protein
MTDQPVNLDDIREGARYILEGHDEEPDEVRLAQDLADVVDEALRLRAWLEFNAGNRPISEGRTLRTFSIKLERDFPKPV